MTTILGLLGYGLLIGGAFMLSPWLGVIVAGLVLVFLAYVNQPEPKS